MAPIVEHVFVKSCWTSGPASTPDPTCCNKVPFFKFLFRVTVETVLDITIYKRLLMEKSWRKGLNRSNMIQHVVTPQYVWLQRWVHKQAWVEQTLILGPWFCKLFKRQERLFGCSHAVHGKLTCWCPSLSWCEELWRYDDMSCGLPGEAQCGWPYLGLASSAWAPSDSGWYPQHSATMLPIGCIQCLLNTHYSIIYIHMYIYMYIYILYSIIIEHVTRSVTDAPQSETHVYDFLLPSFFLPFIFLLSSFYLLLSA